MSESVAPAGVTAGRIPIADLAGGVDLPATIESGQTYGWWRPDGADYGSSPGGTDPGPWYETVLHPADRPIRGDDRQEWIRQPTVVRVRRENGAVAWQANPAEDPRRVESTVRSLLRLDDDLPALQREAPEDSVVQAAIGAYSGLRLVREPPFRCLVSFICSTQMRVERIHAMQRRLARSFGEPVEGPGGTVHAFPTPEALASTDETALRECGLGYRAPYVRSTARMVASGDAHPAEAVGLPYAEARDWLTRFDGVGPKVADCVLLFGLGYREAVPLDTWIQTAIADHFPDCDRDSYGATSAAIRERLGGDIAGYVQTVLFHHLRTQG